jgi:hypothetical protein
MNLVTPKAAAQLELLFNNWSQTLSYELALMNIKVALNQDNKVCPN